MIAPKGKWQVAPLRMIADDICDGFANAGDETGVLEFANGRVVLLIDLLELVVAVKVDFPAEFGELFGKTCFDQADGSVIDAFLGLDGANRWLVVDGMNSGW